ncbi:MAG: hypothetical protein ACXWNQ_08605 [Anaerolineales bacterium]
MKNNNFSRPESTLGDTQPSKRRADQRAEDGSNRVALEMLLHQARTAPDSDAALEYVQQAVDMLPDDPRVQASAQLRVFEKLNRDAFLAFLAETDKQYVIKFRNSRPFSVPKARGPQELYPPVKRNDGERALGMMWWLILGLIPAGLGAVILSPFVVGRAIAALQHNSADGREQRMAWTAILLALTLGFLGLLCTALLTIHFFLG